MSTHNLLVVSDLHLGEIIADATDTTRRHVDRVTAALGRCLAYYAAHSPGGRPWRLIIAGDMIDFVRARLVIDGGGRAWARRALDHIVAAHGDPFAHLARFVAAGHELVVLRGNHDVDLHWDDIQARLVEHLVAFCPASAAEIQSRVTFSRWFWHEAELIYVEHGNQYDRFCSFEHVLEPTLEGELEDPIAHQTFRAFAPHLAGTLDSHAVDHWELVDFLRWVSGLGPRLLVRLVYTYAASVTWMVVTRRRLVRAAARARDHHVAQVVELARRTRLGEDVVRALDGLRERPAGWRVSHGLRMLYIDQIAALIGALGVVGVVLALPLPALARGLLVGGLAIAAALLLLGMSRARDVSPAPKLEHAARRVRALIDVPYVVFGHSHRPARAPLAGGATYFNTGSWNGDSGGGLTHLCVLPGEGRAELRRWCPRTELPIAADV